MLKEMKLEELQNVNGGGATISAEDSFGSPSPKMDSATTRLVEEYVGGNRLGGGSRIAVLFDFCK